MKMRILTTTSSMIACLFAFTVQPARADQISLSLSTGNSAISGYTGPYGSVTVTWLDAHDASITFTANQVGNYQFLFVDGGSAAVNVHASSWTLGAISGTQVGTGFQSPILSSGTPGNEDGLGTFNQQIDNFDSFD